MVLAVSGRENLSSGKARKIAQCLNAMMGLSDSSSVQFLFDYYTPFYGSIPEGPIGGQCVSSPSCHNGPLCKWHVQGLFNLVVSV